MLVFLPLSVALSFLHHGWANYDHTKTLCCTGLVEEITYGNPHSILQHQHEDETWKVVLALRLHKLPWLVQESIARGIKIRLLVLFLFTAPAGGIPMLAILLPLS